VQGSLDWVSGRIYSWTLSHAASGSATLEIRDAGNVVLSLTYPSGMDAGNAFQLQVSTNPSIGPNTTISAALTTLNGQPAAATVSQTGNNQDSAQSVFFYYPPMSQGFTAAGTIALTYASLPSGGRVQFKARAGTLPCTNVAPTVSIGAPAANEVLQAQGSIAVSANAADSDGTVAQVEFFASGAPIGTASSAPFSIAWNNAAPGSYSLTARATDNAGDRTTSAAVPVVVNAAPAVNLTSPSQGATFSAPANIALGAQAADADGSVTSVEFYFGSTLITTLSASPYSFTWTGVPAGSYVLAARATDDRGGTTTSAPVNITVNAAAAQLYFIHADHLNTPRLVADDQQRTVWRWDQQEPFGNSVPDENPGGLGTFDLPLRLPGQYFDKETNLHYNYFRDYDPSLGRYAESDPIGLNGGLNPYRYVEANPLATVDPTGLITCTYDPVNFNPIGCTRVSVKEQDRDLTSWRQDPPIILNTWTVPLPRFGFGIALPNRSLAPVDPSAGRTTQYGEIEFGFFNVQRMYRQNFLVVEEEWDCGSNCVGARSLKRVISCLGSWTPTDLVQFGGFGFRFYQKTLN
jgi:RHS repeat-associated protein